LSYRRLGLLGHDSHKYFRSIGTAAKAVNLPRRLPARAKGLGISKTRKTRPSSSQVKPGKLRTLFRA